MKNYYAIYPVVTGLTVKHLGNFDGFDAASVVNKLDTKKTNREPSIWILDLSDLMNLEESIRVARNQ